MNEYNLFLSKQKKKLLHTGSDKSNETKNSNQIVFELVWFGSILNHLNRHGLV